MKFWGNMAIRPQLFPYTVYVDDNTNNDNNNNTNNANNDNTTNNKVDDDTVTTTTAVNNNYSHFNLAATWVVCENQAV